MDEKGKKSCLDSSISFTELFDLADIQKLQDQFAEATGVASIITQTDGTPITKPSNFCHLCINIIRETEKGRANCYKSDALLGKHNPHGPTIQLCKSGGLWDAGAAITVSGKHIANWLIGQVRDETQTEEKMADYARNIGADVEAVLQAFRQVPSMSRLQFEKISQVLFTLANQLSNQAFNNLQQRKLIKDLEAADKTIRASEEKYRRLSENVPAVVYVFEKCTDGSYRFSYLSSSVKETIGVTAEEGTKNSQLLLEMVHEEDRAGFYKKILTSAKNLSPYSDCFRGIINGETKHFEARSTPEQLADGTIRWEGFFVDITERLQLERQLLQSQKVESIGRLAGGVAHDLNNLLTPIIGYGELILHDSIKGLDAQESLVEVIKAAKRARDLVAQLLAFGRRQTLSVQPISVNDTLLEFEKLLRRTIREDVAISLELRPDLPSVIADRGQLEQVIMNLSVNAADAMPKGGTLILRSSLTNFDENSEGKDNIQPGKYVVLSVIDSGKGMDEETQKNIFEPFFSTKEMMGTGLGLATVYGIVKQHDGHIEVQSTLGEGTTFTVYLPTTNKSAVKVKAQTLAKEDLRGSETILLVEDSDQVRSLTEKLLHSLGYIVLNAENGTKAAELLSKHKGSIDLLLTDVIMPDINGIELFAKLLEIQSTLKVLYMSGYTDDVLDRHGVMKEGMNFIAKPFTARTLAHSVREALDN